MGYVILLLYLIPLPIIVGGLFSTKLNKISFGQQWVFGQFTLWALFQVLGVYFILTKQSLDALVKANNLAIELLVLLCVIKAIFMKNGTIARKENFIQRIKSDWNNLWSSLKAHKLLWIAFLVLYLVQILGMCFFAVNDGDDAYHMAIANIAESSGNMYTANVYAFGNTTLTYRYALAPFPIWIAYLSRISGVHTLTIAHVVLGIMLVTLSYKIYALSAKELFGDNKKKRLQMLCLIAILYIWGNTSSHTAESFLLLRSRQGKALVAGIVFPAIVYLLLHIGKKLEQKRQVGLMSYVLAATVILTGFLGSALGGSLVVLLWGSALVFLAIGYKKFSLLPLGVLSALPGLVYAVLYLLH